MTTSDISQDFKALTLSGDEDKELEEQFSKYPSSFDLKLECLTKPKIQALQNTLLGKLTNGFVLIEEEIQVYNLISYISFRLNDIETAFKYNDKALEKDRRNGIALANRSRYNRHQMNFFEAEEDLKVLEGLYSNDNAAATTEMIAKGELAQSYARFGPKYHELAISMYETIFQTKPRVSREVIILWKYDYCLTLRRARNPFAKSEHPDIDGRDTLMTACKVLTEIIDTSDLKVYIARAWEELGQLVFDMEKHPESFGLKAIEEFIPQQKRHDTSEKYFDIALQLGYGDFDVMEVCAKFYRYFNKPEKAIRLFNAALQLRQTSLCYHHLALSIKKIELRKVNEHKNQDRPWQRRRPGYSKGLRTKPQTKEQSSVKRSIKSGKNATALPYNDQAREVLKNLELALNQDPLNHFASYDKAFTLRQLRKTELARAEFARLLNNLEIGELKISCYEQAGYCCLDMADIDAKKSVRYIHDAIRFFQRAIEVAAAVFAKVKYTSLSSRPLLPTVKSMLTDPELIETHDTHMQRLQNLLKQHGHLLPIAEEVKSDDNKDMNELLNVCLQNERRDDAALLCVLEEIAAEPDEETFAEHLRVILMSASTSLSNAEYEAALTRYEIYYRLLGWRTHKEIRDYDIFLMTDGEPENLCPMCTIAEWLENYCGLKIVNSYDHISEGEQILSALTNFSQRSTAVFLVLKDAKIDHSVAFVTTAIISLEPNKRPPKLVILRDKSVELPILWTNIPTVLLPDVGKKPENSYISSWLSNVFGALMSADMQF